MEATGEITKIEQVDEDTTVITVRLRSETYLPYCADADGIPIPEWMKLPYNKDKLDAEMRERGRQNAEYEQQTIINTNHNRLIDSLHLGTIILKNYLQR